MALSGKYKGVHFRSLLELSFIREAEESGLTFGVDFLYEIIRIPYGAKKKRIYIVDFLVKKEKPYMVEVKPTSRTNTKNFKAKARAALAYGEENNISYVVVTEKDIAHVLSFGEARNILEVEWGVRAQRKIKRDDKKTKQISARGGNRRSRKNTNSKSSI